MLDSATVDLIKDRFNRETRITPEGLWLVDAVRHLLAENDRLRSQSNCLTRELSRAARTYSAALEIERFLVNRAERAEADAEQLTKKLERVRRFAPCALCNRVRAHHKNLGSKCSSYFAPPWLQVALEEVIWDRKEDSKP